MFGSAIKRIYALTLSCPDQVGIAEASHLSDLDSGMYFKRQEILAEFLPFGVEVARERFAPVGEQFQMKWRISDSRVRKRLVIPVSRQGHCLSELMHGWRDRELECDIPCVISNHGNLRGLV